MSQSPLHDIELAGWSSLDLLYDMADGHDEMAMLCDLAEVMSPRGLIPQQLESGELVLFHQDGNWCSDEDLDTLAVWLATRQDLRDPEVIPQCASRPWRPRGLENQEGRTILLIAPHLH
ncbi:MAG: hypothetical protein AB1899_01180 [Pseudomonadota bacterium]